MCYNYLSYSRQEEIMPVIGIIRLVLLIVVAAIVSFALREAGYGITESAIGGFGAGIVVAFALAFNDHATGNDPS